MTAPVIELDFDNIKQNIINHFKLDPVFADYNFEGSALNAIIDILAYNTHTNSYYANMLHNESFIDTAQKRSSVVSIAKELGYVPASIACSVAYVDLNIVSSVITNTLLLERGAQFAASNDIANHNFIVAETAYATRNANLYTFENVKLVAGILVNNTYTVNTVDNIRSIFTIPNKNVDVSTVKVYIRNTESSVDKTEYTVSKNVYELTPESTVFFIQESYDGYYQIYFGENVLGVQPQNGNVITIDYIISTSLDTANECKTFSYNAGFTTVLPDAAMTITTVQSSFGGKDKESIDSIRSNAVRNNTAKERAVTANDYSLILKNNFSFIKNSIVWGGENNVPPVYGKVFISAQPVSGYVITDSVKREIVIPLLRKYSMLTISPEIVDPEYTSIEFTTRVKFNKTKTVTTASAIEQLIKNKIKTFIDDSMTFDKPYYESSLTSKLLALDPGIISIDLRKKIGFNISPPINVVTIYEKSLNNELAVDSILSDAFDSYYNGIQLLGCYIKEIPNTFVISGSSSYKDLGIYSAANNLVTKIGQVNLTTGYFKFTLNVTTYTVGKPYISIRCSTVATDISTVNNQILSMDSTLMASTAPDNVVYVENYVK